MMSAFNRAWAVMKWESRPPEKNPNALREYPGLTASKQAVLASYLLKNGRGRGFEDLPHDVIAQLMAGYVEVDMEEDVKRWLAEHIIDLGQEGDEQPAGGVMQGVNVEQMREMLDPATWLVNNPNALLMGDES